VDGVVEGSALQVGDRVRITVQLVDVASDRSLWAKSYERDLTDILALQSEVAHAIADEIRIQVTPDDPKNELVTSVLPTPALARHATNGFRLASLNAMPPQSDRR
jgi:hypothetical protein